MSLVFPVEPRDGWAAGDLAYCTRPTRNSRPWLERGRVYRVTEAFKPGNIVHHALKVDGIDCGDKWLCSNRFVKLGPVGGRLARINAAAQFTCEHYWKRNCEPANA